MTITLDHPFSRAVHAAARGEFPVPDGGAEVGPPVPGPCDAVAFFTDHLVVAADVGEDWVLDQLAARSRAQRHDVSGGLGAFVGALAARLGDPPIYVGILSVAGHRPAFIPGTLEAGGEVDAEWMAYHHEVSTYTYRGPTVEGTIGVGRGPGERWSVQPLVHRIADSPRGNSMTEMMAAAFTLVPAGSPVFGMTPLQDIQGLRRGLRTGFQPVCIEVLFLTRPDAST